MEGLIHLPQPKTIEIHFSVVFFYISITPQKGGTPIGFYIGIILLSIYISQHGDGLNFLDVSLITTAVCIIIGMVITCWPTKDDR